MWYVNYRRLNFFVLKQINPKLRRLKSMNKDMLKNSLLIVFIFGLLGNYSSPKFNKKQLTLKRDNSGVL
jgi:hypothetical protein